MADTSNGIIYGTAEVKFKATEGTDKTIGWLDENGMQPAGNAPSFMDVFAAQVTDGPVDSILQNPGSDAFTMNLIQLKAQNLVDESLEEQQKMTAHILLLPTSWQQAC